MSIPTFGLSVLREIGWRSWDPIGRADFNGIDLKDCAAQYDDYLLKAAAMSFQGNSVEEIADYLWNFVTRRNGLVDEDPAASAQTASAIEQYVNTKVSD